MVPILLGFCHSSSSRDKVAHFTKERAGLVKCKDLRRLVWIDVGVDKSVPIGGMCKTLFYIWCVLCVPYVYMCVCLPACFKMCCYEFMWVCCVYVFLLCMFSMPVLCICVYMSVHVHVCVVYILLYESLYDLVCVFAHVSLWDLCACRVCWLIFVSLTPTRTYFVRRNLN